MNGKEKVEKALGCAMSHRPSVGGFPLLAECLRLAGVTHNLWTLPAAQSIYMIDGGWVVNQGTPLVTGMVEVAKFDQEALTTALRMNQSGNSTFPEFLAAVWQAGVVGYDVEFANRTVTYMGMNGELYVEEYPAVEARGLVFLMLFVSKVVIRIKF